MNHRSDIESLLSVAVGADADDLPALADLHGKLQALREHLDGPAARDSATALCSALERIVLKEVPDGTAQLEQVAAGIAALRDLLDGVATAVVVPVVAAPAAVAQPAGEFDETEISPDDLSLVQDFLTEAGEHMQTVEGGLLKLEAKPADLDTINAVFRGFHSVKGAAGFLHFRQITRLAHAAESLLDAARQSKLMLTGEPMELVLASVDLTKAMLADVTTAVVQRRKPRAMEALPGLLSRLTAVLTGQPAPTNTHTPAPADTNKPRTAAAQTTQSSPDNTIKVCTERLDQLINMVGELVIGQSMLAQDISASSGAGLDDSGEKQRASRNLAHIAKITRELQGLSMSLRMVPVQGLFQKMHRLVRDTARSLGKEVELVLEGGETELDRNVVEALSDPLVHMVRNSVDHGVELPDRREAAGKSRTGRVLLKASHEAGYVVIEITDDGKGIDAARVLKKARDAGIVSQHQEVPDAEVYKLIFHPGLSTAEKVTDVSGRGVGMDVVRRNVEKLRGRIDITSTTGQGSTFTLRLPLTLAVIDGLLVSVGGRRFVLPLTSVERNLRPSPDQLSTAMGKGEMCLIRGDILPLVRLGRLFDIPGASEDPMQSLVVIVHDDTRRCCLQVDALLGQQQVVIKSLGYGATGAPGIAGGAILGDGNVSLILDVPGIIDLATKGQP
jgi:two-component system, chemotaxis family, sensor kinase CheA